MKITISKCAMRSCILITAFGLLSGAARLQAQTGGDKIFAGDGRTDWGGPIGKATLEISDDTTNLSGKLTVTQGNTGGNVLVLYLQTGTNGGFANTSGFADANDGIRQAISGYSGSQRSTLTFLAGFRPAYAVGIQPGTFGGLWSLANGGGNSLPFITSVNLNPSSTSPAVYTFNFSLANVGLTNGPAVVGKTIKILGTFISNTGYRSPESIAGDTDGTTGYAPTAQTAFVTYTVGTIPTVTYPVTFQVDMGNCIANSLFNPGSDTVIASGSFNASDLSFALTPSANPNIYTATFNDSNTLGTIETYKFTILPGAGGSLPEATDARSFTLTNTQTLPLVYFSDFAPATNATAPLTFSVNMGPETFAGNFNPANGDTVYAYGVFDQNAALAWAPTTALTPSTTNTNVYVGTIGDGNYPGTFGQYKFVYHSNTKGQYIYESTPNRDYFTPATSNSFPTVFFNNASNAVLVSFNVDMSTEIQFSRFTPGSDTIAVAGSFTGWAGGAIPCTNDPAAANTNIYTAVIPILDNVGTGEQYKFITYGPGINGTDYESPASGGNRAFDLPGSNTNLPVVFFSDHVLSDILTSDVTVVFTVEMTNAVGTDLVSWSPSVPVYINGDFLGWPKWTTLLPQMTEGDGGSSLYAYTNVFAAGSPVIVNYKYGMNAVDDEAPSGQNHARYIRGYGTYYMPVDKFGTQLTESSFGNLAVKPPSGGHIPISWLGRPGVHLQTRTNLTTGAWVDHPETDALSATNWPFTGSSQYFRLIHPL